VRESDLTLKTRFQGFSCPFEGFDESFLAFVVRQHAVTITELLLQRRRNDLLQNSDGLGEFLAAWVNDGATPYCPLDPGIGAAHAHLHSNSNDRSEPVAAALALFLASEGVAGAWRATFPVPVRLRFGPFLLNPVRSIEVKSTFGEALIVTDDGREKQRVHFRRPAAGAWEGDGIERLPELSIGQWSFTILPRRAVTLRIPQHVLREAVEEIEPKMLESLKDAVDILRDYAPEYIPWVGRVLTHALLLNPKAGYVESGSMDHYFGFSHFSAYGNPAALAELLIHEASHQYFNILCLVGPFDDETDRNLYYSTAKRRPRSLDRIGVAYHAFANVLIFYRACVARRIADDGWCERHIDRWTHDLRVIEDPLRGNPALTVIGRALCEPLIARLDLKRVTEQ